MPNHVRNIVSFNISGEKLNEILNDIKLDEKGIGSIDFNKLIPMLNSLNIESGSDTNKGLKLFLDMRKEAHNIVNMINDVQDSKNFIQALKSKVLFNAYWINKKLAKVLAFWAICGIISARENAEIGKKPFRFCFMGAVKMYKYRSKQISFTDFNTLIGMKLNPNNR